MFRLKTVLSTAALSMIAAGAVMTTANTSTAAAPSAASADDTSAIYKRMIDQVGPTLVTVKYVMKMEAGGQMSEYLGGMFGDQGRDAESTGVMIEPGGLVLLSNAKMGGIFARFGGGISVNPTDIKVLIGDDTEGLKGKILARDTDLDLCWVQIDDPKASGKTFKALDIGATAASEASIGERLFAVDRMGKFFDHALTVAEGRIGGKARKPRELIIPSGGGVGGDLGMPIFNEAGKVVGVSVLQTPSKEDMEGGDMEGMFGGGGGGAMILPASEVVKATARGKEMAAKAPKEEEKKDASAEKKE